MKNVQAVEEIGTEGSLFNHAAEVLVGGRDYAKIKLNGLCATHPLNLMFLKNTEQFCLHIKWHVTYFI